MILDVFTLMNWDIERMNKISTLLEEYESALENDEYDKMKEITLELEKLGLEFRCCEYCDNYCLDVDGLNHVFKIIKKVVK